MRIRCCRALVVNGRGRVLYATATAPASAERAAHAITVDPTYACAYLPRRPRHACRGMLLTDRRVAVSTADAKLPGLLQNTVFVILGGAHRPHLRMHASTPLNSITKTRAPARIHRLGLVCVGTSAAAPARSLLKLGATVASARSPVALPSLPPALPYVHCTLRRYAPVVRERFLGVCPSRGQPCGSVCSAAQLR